MQLRAAVPRAEAIREDDGRYAREVDRDPFHLEERVLGFEETAGYDPVDPGNEVHLDHLHGALSDSDGNHDDHLDNDDDLHAHILVSPAPLPIPSVDFHPAPPKGKRRSVTNTTNDETSSKGKRRRQTTNVSNKDIVSVPHRSATSSLPPPSMGIKGRTGDKTIPSSIMSSSSTAIARTSSSSLFNSTSRSKGKKKRRSEENLNENENLRNHSKRDSIKLDLESGTNYQESNDDFSDGYSNSDRSILRGKRKDISQVIHLVDDREKEEKKKAPRGIDDHVLLSPFRLKLFIFRQLGALERMIQENLAEPEVLSPEWAQSFNLVKYPSVISSITPFNLARASTHVVYVDIQGYKRLSRMEGDLVLRTFFKLGFMRMNFVGKFALDIHFLTVGSLALQVTGAISSLTLKAIPGSSFAVTADVKKTPTGVEPAFGSAAFSGNGNGTTSGAAAMNGNGSAAATNGNGNAAATNGTGVSTAPVNSTEASNAASNAVSHAGAASGAANAGAPAGPDAAKGRQGAPGHGDHDDDDDDGDDDGDLGDVKRNIRTKLEGSKETGNRLTRREREKRDMIVKTELRYEWSKQQMELAPNSKNRSLWFKKGITTPKLTGDTAQMLAHMVDDFMEEASLSKVTSVTLTFKTAALLLTRENQAYSLIECLYLASYSLRPLIRGMCAPYPWLDERIRSLQRDMEILAPVKSE